MKNAKLTKMMEITYGNSDSRLKVKATERRGY